MMNFKVDVVKLFEQHTLVNNALTEGRHSTSLRNPEKYFGQFYNFLINQIMYLGGELDPSVRGHIHGRKWITVVDKLILDVTETTFAEYAQHEIGLEIVTFKKNVTVTMPEEDWFYFKQKAKGKVDMKQTSIQDWRRIK